MLAEVLKVLVDGGKASAGPPLGPALGPMGVNIMEVINAINEKTKQFEGMKVPVTLTVDASTKDFEVEVGTPPTSALILKELGVEKGSGDPTRTKVGNLTIEQVKKVADMKKSSMLGKKEKERVLEIIGSCVSVGVTVEGKDPKDMQKEIKDGVFDGVLVGD
ncbi:MAG: 50S ribosomal protein L11 [Candidatus Thermoplasmatota archaeon]|nr:50S ribosomal protein L11 [Candidatus Thermoplasmatota archaeon]